MLSHKSSPFWASKQQEHTCLPLTADGETHHRCEAAALAGMAAPAAWGLALPEGPKPGTPSPPRSPLPQSVPLSPFTQP